MSTGNTAGGSLARIFWLLNGLDHNRYGVAATTAVGGAVKRNKVRRWSREYLRRWDGGLVQGNDIVVMANRSGADADHRTFGESVLKSLRRAKLAPAGQVAEDYVDVR